MNLNSTLSYDVFSIFEKKNISLNAINTKTFIHNSDRHIL